MSKKIKNIAKSNVIRIEFLRPESDARIGIRGVKILNVTVEDGAGNIIGVEATAFTRQKLSSHS